MTDGTTTQDPAAIERDIRQTQDEMSRTVDRIGDQLTPRNLLNSLLDQAESNNIDARKLLDGARRNPLALAMIAGGAIWLASDSDAKLPSFGGDDTAPERSRDTDLNHRDYISHMERVDLRDGEDPASYQRRRDIARSNYFMVERGHEEDDATFRQRLDDAAEKFRSARQAWGEQAQRAGSAVADGSKAAVERAQDLYEGNPLIGGLIAGAAGAFLGSLLPETRFEQENLGGIGGKARDMAADQADKLVETAREQKDKLVAGAEQAVSASSPAQPPRATAEAGQPLPTVRN
jgi:ElaB/YqjD/DUF883 family membrane-anchored ribosome-binding protein